ncbi:homoserine kinase [Candidatus Sororendozoicomonas aggregata]|uniref:homoserine kinase n=1 Tax=Candidatus Sororendozoicomonas aggregata TaxID=3073239 RepID=UPI002ED661E0
MAVYTRLNQQDITSVLTHYNLGKLVSYQGIDGGVENTNYFLDIDAEGCSSRYVLTLFEYLPENSLPFFIDYTDELKAAGIPVPAAVRDQQGNALHQLKGKPALIVPCLPGKPPSSLTLHHIHQVGGMLGKIHKTGMGSSLKQKNQRGLNWLDQQQKRLFPLLPEEDALFMQGQWQAIRQALSALLPLPEGLVHGDLFHDNTLFADDTLTGVIDFYQACYDLLVYDIAVTANDWCLCNDGLMLDTEKTTVLLDSYTAVRPLTAEEQKAWPLMLRLAAFRFWISRIITFVHPEAPVDEAHNSAMKRGYLDPNTFKEMLKVRSQG